MIRELCLAPVIMAGIISTVELNTAVSQETSGSGQILSVQTCDRGWGLEAKATTIGLYGAGVQYGMQWEPAETFSVTLTPRFGVSYADRPMKELPQRTQFGLGAALSLGYGSARIGVELFHLSNGKAFGLNVDEGQNIGLNTVILTTGWVF